MTVIAANADRYPVSAQCEILGVPRSTYYYLRSRPEPPPAPDPVEPDVLAVHAESKGRYGARKVKASPGRRGVVASRRRISRIMRENGLSSAYGRKRFKAHPGKPNEAELVYRDSFSDLRDLQAKLSDYVHWYNNFRIHSTLGYMSPVEFRKAGLILSKPSK